MSISEILAGVQVVICAILIVCILLQHRTSGLSATFGGSGALYVQRRGAENVIYKLTIWLSVAFFAFSIVQLMAMGS